MPSPLSELSQLLPSPASATSSAEAPATGRTRQYALVATSAGEHWQCPAARSTMRAQVGMALRWLRQHRHAEGWRLECWAQTQRGSKRQGHWSAQPNEPQHERADTQRPFSWLNEAAERPGEFTVRRRRGLERSWPARHVLRAGQFK
jgi:hypothetical protein